MHLPDCMHICFCMLGPCISVMNIRNPRPDKAGDSSHAQRITCSLRPDTMESRNLRSTFFRYMMSTPPMCSLSPFTGCSANASASPRRLPPPAHTTGLFSALYILKIELPYCKVCFQSSMAAPARTDRDDVHAKLQDLGVNAAERSGAGSRPRHYRHNHACLPAILHTRPSLRNTDQRRSPRALGVPL